MPFVDEYEEAIDKEAAYQKLVEEHQQNRPDHELKRERDIRLHFQVQRNVCQCGWEGEWYRIRSTT